MYEEAGLEREIDRLAERAQLYDSDDALCSVPPPSATTRTGSCAAPQVSTPISPPTSATTATSCGVTRSGDRRAGADHHGYVGRLRAAWEALGGDPDRLGDPDHAAREPVRGRGAGADVEAKGRVRHARRPDRRPRRGRRPLLPAQPRHHARPGPGPRARAEPGEPRLLRPVRPRPDREHPQEGERARGDRARCRRAGRERRGAPPFGALAGQAAARAAGGDRTAAERRAPHRLTAYCHEVAQEFSAFYRDCRVVGAARRGATRASGSP